MIFAILKEDKGASVIAVALMILILIVSGTVFVSLFSTSIEVSTAEVSSMRALYAAEAGLETAMARLKQSPVSSNWTWKEGYVNKTTGSGRFDVEALQYEMRDGTLTGANQCEKFESALVSAGANPARTVLVTLSWDGTADLGLELYDNAVTDCNNPTASAALIASSLTSDKPEVVRYRIQSALPSPLTYTARVTGSAGTAYLLRMSHPDETLFSTANQCGQPDGPPFDECMRAVISIGKVYNTRREVFAGFKKTP